MLENNIQGSTQLLTVMKHVNNAGNQRFDSYENVLHNINIYDLYLTDKRRWLIHLIIAEYSIYLELSK